MIRLGPRRERVALGLPVLGAWLAAAPGAADPPAVRPDDVRAPVEFLASAALNGRGSGTHDELVAATYAAAQLRQFGVEPAGDAGGYVQKVDLETRALAGPPVLVLSPEGRPEVRFTHGREIVVPAMAAARVEGPLQRLEGHGGPVKRDAVVLLSTSGGAVGVPRERIGEAIERGAAAVLVPASPEARGRWDALAARLPDLASVLTAMPET